MSKPKGPAPVKVSTIHVGRNGKFTDSAWYAFASSRAWIEIRTTPTGMLRVGRVHRGTHPYFTPESPK